MSTHGEVNHPVPAETWNALFKYYHRTKLACIGLSAALVCTTFGWLVHPVTVVRHEYTPKLDTAWLALTREKYEFLKSHVTTLRDYIDEFPPEYRAAVEHE